MELRKQVRELTKRLDDRESMPPPPTTISPHDSRPITSTSLRVESKRPFIPLLPHHPTPFTPKTQRSLLPPHTPRRVIPLTTHLAPARVHGLYTPHPTPSTPLLQ